MSAGGRRLAAAAPVLAATLAWLPRAWAAEPPPRVRLERSAVTAAMRAERGYDRRATTNQSRLQSRVLLRLARETGERHPGAQFEIDHEDWFQAYLDALELRPEEAPLSVRLSHQHQYDILVDARPGAVVERHGPRGAPALAANVRWRSRHGTTRYSYRDPLARPVLEMTFERSVSYRLLELDAVVAFEEIAGVAGRPASGPLSLLFKLIGQAQAVWSRSVLAEDGAQLLLGKGRKGFFTRTALVLVQPDGRVDPELPAGRGDLAALAERLQRPLAVTYRPWQRE